MDNSKERLRTIIEEYWRGDIPKIKKRDIAVDMNSDLISDIIGPRRAGKTYTMFSIISDLTLKINKRQTIYINFENRKLFPLTSEYLNNIIQIIHEEDLLSNGIVYLFLDEIQRLDNWEKYIRSIYDEFKGKIKLFISGSTSELIKSNASYLLTGRHITTLVLPLSFKEFLEFNNFVLRKVLTEEVKAKIGRYLKEYIEFGGFPEVVLNKNKEALVETLFLDIITKDVSKKVKNPTLLEELAYFLCSNSAKPISFNTLKKTFESRFKISVPTLERMFYLMKEAFLFYDSMYFSYKLKNQMKYPKKIFCIDTGFINYYGFKFSEDKGKLMENVVAIELMRHKIRNPEIYYWKDYRQNEIDFVIKKGTRIERLIQVTYSNSMVEINKREIDTLLKGMEELNCKDLLIITWDYEDKIKSGKNTIIIVPLWKWLLNIPSSR